jgi:FkbM family methyltransferase
MNSFYQSLVNEVILGDCYKLKKFKLKHNPNIIDIGANIGVFSKYAAEIYPDSKIFSFELMQSNYEEAKERLSDFDYISLTNKGVVGDSTPYGIFENKSNRGGHKIIYNDSNDYCNKNIFSAEFKKQDVNYIRFNEILDQIGEKVDLLKLDCEGGEYDIIFQCERLKLFDQIDTIIMEAHGRNMNQFKRLLSILKNNYEFFTVKGHLVYCSNTYNIK